MEQVTLYIIGNGFDLAHGLKTGYQDFKDWLINNRYKSFVYRFESLYPEVKTNEWKDLEGTLGHFDMNNVIDFDKHFVECSDSYDGKIGVGQNIKSVTDTLPYNLWNWICSIDLSSVQKKFELQTDSLFVNFNYTLTLENVYGINPEHIFHIHGSLNDKAKQLIVGYAVDEKFDNGIHNDQNNPTDDNIRRNLMTNYIKPIKLCKCKFHVSPVFPKMKDINHVVVLGHSCSKVDEPYFKDIAKAISKKADWEFYIHDMTKQDEYEAFAMRVVKQDELEQTFSVKSDKKFPIL